LAFISHTDAETFCFFDGGVIIQGGRLFTRKRTLAFLFTTIIMFLGGCTTTLQKQSENLSRALDGITPADDPVHGTALVLLPSDAEIQKNHLNYDEFGLRNFPRSGISDKMVKYMITMIKNRYQFTADAIRKRSIFDSVSVAYQNGNPASYPVGDNDYLVFVDIDGWFLRARNIPKALLISSDKNKLSLDSLYEEAKALRTK
jgi:hypothetical protein